MAKKTVSSRSRIHFIHEGLDWLLYGLSTYALPLVIGLISLITLLAWPSQYPATEAKVVSFQVIGQTDAWQKPEQAIAQVASQPLLSFFDTQLSTLPV